MNKFITRVAKLVLGLSLAAGVGVAVGSQKASRADAATRPSASTGVFLIDFYDESAISSTSGTNLSNSNYSSFVKVATGLTATSVVTACSVSGTVRYGMNGGLTLGANNTNAASATFTIGSSYAVNKISVYGAKYDSNTLTIGGSEADSGTIANKGTTFSNLGNPMVWDNLNGITSIVLSKTSGKRVTAYTLVCEYSTGSSATYTGVTVSEKTALTGTYKGDAYYECQASVSGTGGYSHAVTWSITSTSTYGSGTSIANKASIDSNGKITFLDNCTVYVWATAADGTTHNTTGFSVVASGLQDNPINSWTKITSTSNVHVSKVYALSNDGTLFATGSVSSNNIALTTSIASIGYVALESTDGGYYVRFATESAGVWSASGNYIKWANDSTKLSSSASPDSTHGKWSVVENSTNGVYLRENSSSRHLGLNGSTDIRAYASSNLGDHAPVYLYEAGSLPVIACDTISLTGKPSEAMSIGDTATLGYYALDGSANEWTGDVTYTISNEKDSSNNTTTGVVELSATSGASVTLTAKKAGSARVSVQDDGGNADPDYVDITVLADPVRVDLPVGSYTVTISAANEASDTLPATRDYEIKAKEGTGANRVWYRNLTVSFSNITVLTSYHEYESAKTNGALTVTNNSNATISDVEVHYYKYENDGVGIYVNDSILTPTSSTGTSGTDNDLYRGYTNITGNTFALCNKNSSYTNKFYSVTITLTVADENEEFHSLVVSKSNDWTTANNGTYKAGNSPTNSGLVVTANYSNNGGVSITRSEDVTAQVTHWAYTPSTLSTSDTSFAVVATWDGHDSASFTVTNISVTSVTGPISSGRYYIMNSDKTFGLNAEAHTSGSPEAVDLSSSNSLTAFDVVLKDDNLYEISVTVSSTKYYLVCNTTATSSSNTAIRVMTNPSLKSNYWSLSDDGVTETGAYHMKENTTGSTYRYLACYNEQDWRGYTSTGSGDPEIQFVAEGSLAGSIANSLMNDITCNNGATAPSTSTWSTISGNYGNITIAHEKTLLTAGTANENSENVIEQALARYDYIVGKYNKAQGITAYNDFLGRNPAAIGAARLALGNMSENNTTTITLIVIISMVSVTAIGGYFFIKRRKVN